MIVSITDDAFADEVLAADLPVLVDFWAEWCGPCHRILPVLEELAVEYAGRLRIVKLDADANPVTVRAFGIMSMPTLTVFHRGVVVSQSVGAQPKGRLRAQIDRALTTDLSAV